MKKIVALVLSLALVLALGTVAFAGIVDAPYYGKDTNTLATYSNIELDYHKAKEPTVKDGKQTEVGYTAHYDLGELGTYQAVDSLAKANLVIYSDKDMKNVVLYLAEVEAVEFIDAKPYTNFGTKCGQCNIETEKGATYYSAIVNAEGIDGEVLLKGCKAEDADITLRVDGKFIPAELVGLVTLVGHTSVPVLENGEIVGYKCANCGLAAVKAANTMSIPENVIRIPDTLYYFPAAAAAAASTGVTSAKTFDAGVAMYAGLALMSVAGSAVVIGKKKEF